MKTSLTRSLDSLFRWFSLLLISTLLASSLMACGSATMREPEPEADSAGAVAEEPGSVPPAQPGLETGEVASSVEDVLDRASAQAEGPRVIIYTGNISLVIQDTQAAVTAITALAGEQGGYVAGSNVYQANNVPRGTITIRVPAENYEDTLAKLRALAIRVESENSSTQDVTEEFTDLQARQTNLEFTETALQELLEERQRVGSTSDILEVYRELTNVRGQIEQIEGRLRYLANQSALSTLTIELIPDVLYQPVSVAGWEPQGVAKEALQALVAALQGLTSVLIWVVIFLLPLLIILLIPVVIVIWLLRWGWKRYKARRSALPPTVAGATTPE
jgi:hypothetical protein